MRFFNVQNKFVNKDKNSGFTLIELLVVIAVIGILGAIILSSLNRARDRARDVAIKGELSSVRSKAELYINNTGNFGDSEDDCEEGMFAETTNDGLGTLIDGLEARTTVECGTDEDINATSWSVSAVLLANPSITWCVDSTAYSGESADADADGNCD